eukprot:TRINITY_DN22906_c1_g1_i1.p1 TRINITY_DN22906_c1_g1~~TRINITY_DN22906_c1_g1_i1.p1  ORF type:complete len:1257 (+),score=544.89 TRINITY_DN22906_c1_g1_i1:417-3773(+)
MAMVAERREAKPPLPDAPHPPQAPRTPKPSRLHASGLPAAASPPPPARPAAEPEPPPADPADPDDPALSTDFPRLLDKARNMPGPVGAGDLPAGGAEMLFDHWALSYLYDLGGAVSLGKWYDTVLAEMQLVKEYGTRARQLRVAACFLVLERAAAHIGRIGSTVLQMLAQEVYANPTDRAEAEARAKGTRPPVRSAGSASSCLAKQLCSETCAQTFGQLQGLRSQIRRDNQRSEQQKVTAQAQAKASKLQFLGLVFGSWRKLAPARRMRERFAIQRMDRAVRLTALKKAMHVWRCDTLEARSAHAVRAQMRESSKEISRIQMETKAKVNRLEEMVEELQRAKEGLLKDLDRARRQVEQMDALQDEMIKTSQEGMERQVKELRTHEEEQRKVLGTTQEKLEKTKEVSQKAQVSAKRILLALASKAPKPLNASVLMATSSGAEEAPPPPLLRPQVGAFLSLARLAKATPVSRPVKRRKSQVSPPPSPQEGELVPEASAPSSASDVAELLAQANPERVLLYWMRRCLREAAGDGARAVSNFTTDLQDVESLCVLAGHCFPAQFRLDLQKVHNPRKRATKLLQTLHAPVSQGGVGMPVTVTAEDITQGYGAANLVLCALMLEKWVELCPPDTAAAVVSDRGEERERTASSGGGDDEVEEINATFEKIQFSNEAWGAVVSHVRSHCLRTLLGMAKGGGKAALTDDTVQRDRDLYVLIRRERVKDIFTMPSRRQSIAALTKNVSMRGASGVMSPRSGRRASRASGRRSSSVASPTADMPREREPSTVATPSSIGTPVVTAPDSSPTRDQDLSDVEEVLAGFFEELRKIYKFYSRLSPKSQEMTNQEFMRFVNDCNLVDKATPQAAFDVVFTRVNWADADDGAARRKVDSSQRELSPTEFVEALVRIAAQKYTRVPSRVQDKEKEKEKREEEEPEPAPADDDDPFLFAGARRQSMADVQMSTSLADKVHYLLTREVVPRASASEVDDFKALVYSARIQDVVNDHQTALHRIFLHFSAGDKTSMHSATMNFKEFQQMIAEARLIGESLTKHDVAFIFSNAQSDDDNQGDEEMVYREFVESLVAVAFFRNPNIMLPPAARLRDFLVRQFFPAISAARPRLKLGPTYV